MSKSESYHSVFFSYRFAESFWKQASQHVYGVESREKFLTTAIKECDSDVADFIRLLIKGDLDPYQQQEFSLALFQSILTKAKELHRSLLSYENIPTGKRMVYETVIEKYTRLIIFLLALYCFEDSEKRQTFVQTFSTHSMNQDTLKFALLEKMIQAGQKELPEANLMNSSLFGYHGMFGSRTPNSV